MNDIVTISGNWVNEKPSVIVRFNTKTGVKQKVTIKGRWLYCLHNELPELNGTIVVPDKSRSLNVFSTVLAVGEGCGKAYDIEGKKMEGLSEGLEDRFSPGDKIITPFDHTWGIMTSPYDREEKLIHEDIVLAIIGD